MYNQTECNLQNDRLSDESIVAIVVSGCSLITALGTFAYFKLLSKFKDIQQSEIELTTTQSSDTKATTIKVKFVNDERFEVTAKLAKNGKDGESGSIVERVQEKLSSIIVPKEKQEEKKEMSEIVVANFNNAINNNNAGDKIIAHTRQGLILNAFNTFLKTVKAYNVAEDEVKDISSVNYRSRTSSSASEFIIDKPDKSSDNNLSSLNHNSEARKVYIPHPTPKIMHSKSFPEMNRKDILNPDSPDNTNDKPIQKNKTQINNPLNEPVSHKTNEKDLLTLSTDETLKDVLNDRNSTEIVKVDNSKSQGSPSKRGFSMEPFNPLNEPVSRKTNEKDLLTLSNNEALKGVLDSHNIIEIVKVDSSKSQVSPSKRRFSIEPLLNSPKESDDEEAPIHRTVDLKIIGEELIGEDLFNS